MEVTLVQELGRDGKRAQHSKINQKNPSTCKEKTSFLIKNVEGSSPVLACDRVRLGCVCSLCAAALQNST